MDNTESTWGDNAPATASGDDLSKTVTLTLKGREVSVTFDLSEMTPRLRKKLAKLESDDDAADAMVEYLATCVTAWTLCDKAGAPVPLTVDAIEGVAYKDISAIVSALNGAALPNATEGAN